MSYLRVIPRDLFNEANLLKCYGQLYLQLEKLGLEDLLRHTCIGECFDVRQNPDDGSLTVHNIELVMLDQHYRFFRPLNSREPWPLYLYVTDDCEIAVFTDDGQLTEEFLYFVEKIP